MTRTVLVTGASRGIGRATALEFAKEGYNVVINYSGSREKALDVQKEVESFGVKSLVVQADVAVKDDVKSMIDEIITEFGIIDCVVNNAGITKDNLVMRMKENEFADVINTNIQGVFNVVQAVSRPMLKQKSGVIINMSSVVASIGNAGQANYVASKAAVEGMTKTFAREFASRGIRVNAVAPGFIISDMTDKLSDDIKEIMLTQIPLHQFGDAEDVAKAVTFLASDKAKYITGQTVHVNGGMYMN